MTLPTEPGSYASDGRVVAGRDLVHAVVVDADRRHREDITRLGLHHDGLSAAGACLCDAVEQRLLDRILNGSIDGQDDVVAGHRCARHVLATCDGVASGGHFDRGLARLAAQDVVVLALETGGADAVDVGPADDAAARGPPGSIRRSSR